MKLQILTGIHELHVLSCGIDIIVGLYPIHNILIKIFVMDKIYNPDKDSFMTSVRDSFTSRMRHCLGEPKLTPITLYQENPSPYFNLTHNSKDYPYTTTSSYLSSKAFNQRGGLKLIRP